MTALLYDIACSIFLIGIGQVLLDIFTWWRNFTRGFRVKLNLNIHLLLSIHNTKLKQYTDIVGNIKVFIWCKTGEDRLKSLFVMKLIKYIWNSSTTSMHCICIWLITLIVSFEVTSLSSQIDHTLCTTGKLTSQY